ncbi:MAG: glycolate oxidase subunit GlcF [Burkholderiaceae bacterium]
METRLARWFSDTHDGRVADEILRKCVHCGFCTATCPTYQILGDENDGPRGRIYLMKAVMEGEPATRETLLHLDRCLTCRSCETTCPSGVRYGHLVDVGRKLVEERVSRPWRERLTRLALRETLTRRWLFDPAMRVARRFRPLLPPPIQAKVPRSRPAGAWPTRGHRERVLLLDSCTQGAMMPAIDRATARVLDRFGARAIVARGSGCCGALRHHLADERGALAAARRNIDAWWPSLEEGVEAILINASGCGVMVKDYGHLLRNDARYAERAARVAELACDPIEWLERKLAGDPSDLGSVSTVGGAGDQSPDVEDPALAAMRVAFHPPCTLQHGQAITGRVEALLRRFGAQLCAVPDAHLCCGSAGTYSVLQPELSRQLRDRKLEALHGQNPALILSANVGCLAHLEGGTETPVRHWIEWLDARLAHEPAR